MKSELLSSKLYKYLFITRTTFMITNVAGKVFFIPSNQSNPLKQEWYPIGTLSINALRKSNNPLLLLSIRDWLKLVNDWQSNFPAISPHLHNPPPNQTIFQLALLSTSSKLCLLSEACTILLDFVLITRYYEQKQNAYVVRVFKRFESK